MFQDLHYSEPTYEDVLNVTGKPMISSMGQDIERESVMQDKPQEMKLLSTWAPEKDSGLSSVFIFTLQINIFKHPLN